MSSYIRTLLSNMVLSINFMNLELTFYFYKQKLDKTLMTSYLYHMNGNGLWNVFLLIKFKSIVYWIMRYSLSVVLHCLGRTLWSFNPDLQVCLKFFVKFFSELFLWKSCPSFFVKNFSKFFLWTSFPSFFVKKFSKFFLWKFFPSY